MNAPNSPRSEWYVAPPSRRSVAVAVLIGLCAGALIGLAIDAYRPGMLVILVLAALALGGLAARHRLPAMKPLRAPRRSPEAAPAAAAPAPAPAAAPAPAPAPTPAPAPASVADEIAKLGQLRKAGLITQAEFAAQKAKLLNS